MSAQAALAFVARREGSASLPASRWAHVMSLELGWMSPNQAKRYVEACTEAGLLELAGEELRLTYDEDGVDIPRRLRPDPEALPAARPDATHAAETGFEAWAKRLAEHEGRPLGDVLDDVAAMQERMGGLLHAEAALLRLMAMAGMDVREEAEQELAKLMQGGATGSAG